MTDMIKELKGLIGPDATLRLLSRFGGLQVYIPKSPEPDQELSLAVGLDEVRRLAATFGGESLELPVGRREIQGQRRLRIVEMRQSGEPVQSIARKLGCSRRYIYQVLAIKPDAS